MIIPDLKHAVSLLLFVGAIVGTTPAIAQDVSNQPTESGETEEAPDDAEPATSAELSNKQVDVTRESYALGSGKDVVFVPMLIEFEPSLEPLSQALSQVLSVRLAKYGVEISSRVLDEKDEKVNEETPYKWNITLRRISERHLIITIDSTDDQASVSEVRTVSHNPNTEQLAWTMALVVEEMVTPYMSPQGELPALGAGLAILEPKEVAGTKKEAPVQRSHFPRFSALGVGLTASGVWTIDEILTGPRLLAKGMISKRAVAMVSLGWQGSANYSARSVSGSMSQIPIELFIGSVFFQQRVVKIVGWAGFSLGFSVYKTHSMSTSRTDMTFQPGGNLLVEIEALLVSPLEFFLQGGCNFPFVRDVLVNNGTEVYSHVWVMPTITLGLQLGF